MIKAVLFDMDGVVIDSSPVWNRLIGKRIAAYFGPHYLQLVVNSGDHGSNISDTWEKMASQGFRGDKQTYLDIYKHNYREVYTTAPLALSFIDVWKKLRERGIQTGMVSNSSAEWLAALTKRLEKDGSFDIVVSLGSLPLPHKPAPDGYLYAIKNLHRAPSEVLIVEDTTLGVEAGLASGALVVQYTEFTRNQATSDHRVVTTSSMSAIPGIIDEINRQDSFGQRPIRLWRTAGRA